MGSLLGGAGFAEVHTTTRPLDAAFDAATTVAMGTGFGRLGWQFGRLDAPFQDALRERAAARLAQLPTGLFIDSSEVLLTTARRP